MLHTHVTFGTPGLAGHVPQPGTDEHQGGVAIGEGANHPGSVADLPVKPFNDVIASDLLPKN